MKIKTNILKAALSKVMKCVSNNPLFPITSLINVEFDDNILTFITTNGTDYFKIKLVINIEDIENTGKFKAVVEADTLNKLVGKTTKEYIELKATENYLEIRGNGSYKLNMAINEDNELIDFMNFEAINFNRECFIDLKELQNAITIANASTLKDKNTSIKLLTGYYIGKEVITTDSQLVCKINKQIIEEPILISPEFAELILAINMDAEDTCNLKINDDGGLLLSTNKYIIYGRQLDGKDIFENNVIPSITNLTNLNYAQNIVINKTEFLEALDRISLFIGFQDNNSIKFIVKDNILSLNNLQLTAKEELIINSSIKDYECVIDYLMLKKQLKSLISDNICIEYGDQKSIQLIDGNITLVIALIEK